MTIDPSVPPGVPPYLPPPAPPIGAHAHRLEQERPRPTSMVVAAILTFVQAGLGLLLGLGSLAVFTVLARGLDGDYPYVDGDGNRYASPDGYEAGVDGSGPLTFDPGGDAIPTSILFIGLAVTAIGFLVLLVLGLVVLTGRRWAAVALAVVETLFVVGCLVSVVQELRFEGDVVSAVVRFVFSAGFSIAVLVCLAIAFAQLRSGRSDRITQPVAPA